MIHITPLSILVFVHHYPIHRVSFFHKKPSIIILLLFAGHPSTTKKDFYPFTLFPFWLPSSLPFSPLFAARTLKRYPTHLGTSTSPALTILSVMCIARTHAVDSENVQDLVLERIDVLLYFINVVFRNERFVHVTLFGRDVASDKVLHHRL